MRVPIPIHVINNDGKYTILHVETLSLYSVTKEIGDILDFYENVSTDTKVIADRLNIPQIRIDEIIKYFQDENEADISKNPEWVGDEPRTLCLLISQNCNLECGYCFADHGKYRGGKRLMDIDTAMKSINKILDKNYRNFILFFGGEPFLNFSLMKEIEAYRQEIGLGIKYSAITNGTIMSEEIKTFINNNFCKLCISLDGTKEINDLQRYGIQGSVHDEVIKNIQFQMSRKYTLGIKSTITKKSFNKFAHILDYISSLDIDTISFAFASMIPHESEFYISDDEYEACAKELSAIIKKSINQLINSEYSAINKYIFDILRQIFTKNRKIHYCSAGREYVAVTAEGDVYPCHGFVGIDEFHMGNVHDEEFPGIKYHDIKNKFEQLSVYASEECSSCWARFLCGGDCAWHSYFYNKNLSKPTQRNCLLIKTILEALLPNVADALEDYSKRYKLLSAINNRKYI